MEFNAIVFTGNTELGNKGFITYRKQTSIKRFETFVNDKFPKWKWITIYDRKTNEKTIIKKTTKNGI